MLRVCLIIMSFGVTSLAHAELMTCDKTKRCSFVCYFPSSSTRSERVYPNDGVSVDRVRVEAIGDNNLLYTVEGVVETTTMPTYRSLETLILPRDYPCRLSPTDLLNSALGSQK